jgi:SRSO17 transposase
MSHPKDTSDINTQDIGTVGTQEIENPLIDIAKRFVDFCKRFAAPFQSKTRSREPQMQQYVSGLVQSDKKKNMERIAEVVPDSDAQALQHFLSDSKWDEREVLDLIATEANKKLGDPEESCLIIDESGIVKKGKKSVGVSRQWCGQIVQYENCQVGVFAALCHGDYQSLTDVRLFLPEESWIDDKERCLAAGVPAENIVFKRKQDLALEMVKHARELELEYFCIGCDGFYGEYPAFLRSLDSLPVPEIFMADVHRDQRVYLENPEPIVPLPKSGKRGKKPTRLKAQTKPTRVDEWASQRPVEAWKRMTLRDSTKGELQVDIHHVRVWLWDGIDPEAHCWHLVVRRELNAPSKLKYSLSNADKDTPDKDTPVSRLAFMQGQRYWVEHALKNGKPEVGLGDYQVRGWEGWHHHMALVMMAMLFMLEEKIQHPEDIPLLSYGDIRILLAFFLPRRDITFEEVLRQMKHRQRQSSIDSAYKRQRIQQLLGVQNE